jgi:hypothetical protein
MTRPLAGLPDEGGHIAGLLGLALDTRVLSMAVWKDAEESQAVARGMEAGWLGNLCLGVAGLAH